MNMYARFGAMIASSIFIMYWLMYLNTYQLDHVYVSESRTYMAIIMGAAMAIIMLAFMQHMLTNRRANVGIAVCSIIVSF